MARLIAEVEVKRGTVLTGISTSSISNILATSLPSLPLLIYEGVRETG